jgi:hypothetical protein
MAGVAPLWRVRPSSRAGITRHSSTSAARGAWPRRERQMPTWKSIALGACLSAVATGFVAADPVTVRSDVVLRAGPGADFSAIGHIPGGTRLETVNCTGGWCHVEFKGIIGFVAAGDVSTAAARIENDQRGRARFTPAPRSTTRSAPPGEDADLFVLPAKTPLPVPSPRRFTDQSAR